MLPLSTLEFCDAEKLHVGDFAYLLDYENAPVLVGSIPNSVLAIFLNDPADKPGILEVRELRGTAVPVRGFEFEIDPTSGAEYNLGSKSAKSLCARGQKLAYLATGFRGLMPVEIGEFPSEMPNHLSKVFLGWRIVKRIDDDCHVLFERSASE